MRRYRYINPIVMMFIGGGKYIEDIRKVKADKGLGRICKMEKVPSADAIRDWLRREGKEKIGYMEIINKNLTRRVLKKAEAENPQMDLFRKTEEYCYHGIATNYTEEEKNSDGVIWWHNALGIQRITTKKLR